MVVSMKKKRGSVIVNLCKGGKKVIVFSKPFQGYEQRENTPKEYTKDFQECGPNHILYSQSGTLFTLPVLK